MPDESRASRDPGRLDTERLALSTSRRGFLARLGAALGAAAAADSLGAVVRPGKADALHFCGHIYTTDSCPHPTGLPRVDLRNLPVRAADGRPVDDLGRLVDVAGRPIDEEGNPLLDAQGRPLPPAGRSRLCLDTVAELYGMHTHVDGSWYRCCGGARPATHRLLRAHAPQDQRRRGVDRVLLSRSQGLLRSLLPVPSPVLTGGRR